MVENPEWRCGDEHCQSSQVGLHTKLSTFGLVVSNSVVVALAVEELTDQEIRPTALRPFEDAITSRARSIEMVAGDHRDSSHDSVTTVPG